MEEVKFTPTKKFDKQACTLEIAGRSVMAHCHYFMCGVLKTILGLKELDGTGIYTEEAEKAYYETFKGYLSIHPELKTDREKLAVAVDMYRTYGYGNLILDNLSEGGGKAYAPSAFFVTGWLARYGRYEGFLGYFTSGFIAGILSAIYGKPVGSYKVKENQCLITGADKCEFEVEAR